MTLYPVGDALVAELEPIVAIERTATCRPPRSGSRTSTCRGARAATSTAARRRGVGRRSSPSLPTIGARPRSSSTCSPRTTCRTTTARSPSLSAATARGALGAPLDRRGGPARHRDARLPAGHPGGRPGRSSSARGWRTWRGLRVRDNDDSSRSVAYVSFQELATRVSHRNTGRPPTTRSATSARPDRRRREPAHALLPEPGDGGARDRPDQTMRAITAR